MSNKPTSYHWDPKDKIEITGLQYDVIQKFASLFAPLVQVNQDIWASMIEKGQVKDSDNNVVVSEPKGETAEGE